MAAIDCLQRERPVTAGSDDGSVRLWKVVQESQLVFTGHKYDRHVWPLLKNVNFIMHVHVQAVV